MNKSEPEPKWQTLAYDSAPLTIVESDSPEPESP